MKKIKTKLCTVLKMSITIMLIMVIFIDENLLNSLVLQSNNVDGNLVVQEVASTIIERNTSQLSGKVDSDNNDTDKKVEEVVNTSTEKKEESSTVVVLSANNKEHWAWPTNSNYRITSYYGYRWGSLHGAIDISGTGYGSNIYAANSGVVTTVKGGCVTGDLSCNGRGGNYIVIKHNSNNYYTVYMHLKDIYVSKGQTVSRGQVIGTMGNTGNVSPAPTSSKPYNGTHLHFALYIGEPYNGGYAVNPMRLY